MCHCTKIIAAHLHIPDLAAVVRDYASNWDNDKVNWMHYSSINTFPCAMIEYDITRQIFNISAAGIECQIYPTCVDDMVSLAIENNIENTLIKHDMPLDTIRKIMSRLRIIGANVRENCPLVCLCCLK